MPFFARENESFLRINFCFFLIGLLFSWAKNGINGRRHFMIISFNQKPPNNWISLFLPLLLRGFY